MARRATGMQNPLQSMHQEAAVNVYRGLDGRSSQRMFATGSSASAAVAPCDDRTCPSSDGHERPLHGREARRVAAWPSGTFGKHRTAAEGRQRPLASNGSCCWQARAQSDLVDRHRPTAMAATPHTAAVHARADGMNQWQLDASQREFGLWQRETAAAAKPASAINQTSASWQPQWATNRR